MGATEDAAAHRVMAGQKPKGVAGRGAGWGALVLAAALPIVLVHIDFQPGFSLTAGSHVHIVLSDLAVLACLGAAVVVAAQSGLGPLRNGIPTWIALAALLGLVVAACFYPLIGSDPYPWRDHIVTAGKYVEYALLAPAVVLLLRRRDDLAVFVGALVATSVVASAIGTAQFLGWGIAKGWPSGYRQPSFLGHHDFAALSGLALAVALAAIALPSVRVDRRLAIAGGVAGTLGLFLSGSLAAALGLAAGGAVAAFAARRSLRRAAVILGISLAVLGGVVLFRGGDVKSFLHLIGIGQKDERRQVETYVQRTMLAYLGWRVFLDHPVAGAGWQASNDEYVYAPFLPVLHRKFPNTPPEGFPSPAHPYGIQNAYVQALADLGVIGLLVFLAALLTPLVQAAGHLLRGPPAPVALLAAMWLLVTMGVLTALGIVAGIPTDALLWIAVGLCVAPVALAATVTTAPESPADDRSP